MLRNRVQLHSAESLPPDEMFMTNSHKEVDNQFQEYLKVSEKNSFEVSPLVLKKRDISVHFTNIIRWKQEPNTETKWKHR